MSTITVTFATATAVAMQEIAPSTTLTALLPALSVLLSLPATEMAFTLHGARLEPNAPLSPPVSHNDLVLVEHVEHSPPTPIPQSPQPVQATHTDAMRAMASFAQAAAAAQRSHASNTQPQANLLNMLRVPATLARLRSAAPALAAAVDAGDGATAERLMRQLEQSQGGGGMAAMEGVEPAVAENFEAAYERNPESFGQVTMLFVDAKINNVSVTAFVDSGAQATILSVDAAKRCGIFGLLDTRFSGVARGVGTAKILGRVHLALLHVQGEVLETTFTVMADSSYDMLLGLDMLKRHQASIDLKQNVLRIGGAVAEFLPEHRIPKSMLKIGPSPAAEGEGDEGVSGSVVPTPAAAAGDAAAMRAAGGASAMAGGGSGGAVPAAAGSGGGGVGKVEALIALGFSREESVQALENCGGNQEQAAALLSQAKYGF